MTRYTDVSKYKLGQDRIGYLYFHCASTMGYHKKQASKNQIRLIQV